MSLQIVLGAVIGAVATIFFVMAGLAFIEPVAFGAPSSFYNFMKDIVGPIAAGFGGAMSGAAISYKYQRDSERIAERKLCVKNYNKAMAILLSKSAALVSIKTSVMQPYDTNALRFLVMPSMAAFVPNPKSAIELIGEDLVDRGFSNIYNDLFMAEELCSSAIEALFARNALIEEMRVKADAVANKTARHLSLSEMADIHGVASLVRIYALTEEMINAVDKGISNVFSVIGVLRDSYSQKISCSEAKIITLKLKPDAESALVPASPPVLKSSEDIILACSKKPDPFRLTLAWSNWKPRSFFMA